MKIKIFCDEDETKVENQFNEFFESKTVEIIQIVSKPETAVLKTSTRSTVLSYCYVSVVYKEVENE